MKEMRDGEMGDSSYRPDDDDDDDSNTVIGISVGATIVGLVVFCGLVRKKGRISKISLKSHFSF